MGTLEGVGGRLQHFATGGHVTGERHHAHLRMLDQCLPDAGTAPADHIQHAPGQYVAGDLRQQQRGEGRLLAWFEDHRVARCERWGQFPGGHHQRVVPRRDRRHHPDRVTPDHAGEAAQVLAADGTGHAPRGAGKITKTVCHRRQFVAQGTRIRLATVERLQPGESMRMRVDQRRQAQQQVGTFCRCGLRPALEGALRRRNGTVDLFRGGLRDFAQQFASGGIEDRFGGAFATHQLVVDQKLGWKTDSRFSGLIHGRAPG